MPGKNTVTMKHYAVELRSQGVNTIWGIGVVVKGKKVWMESLLL